MADQGTDNSDSSTSSTPSSTSKRKKGGVPTWLRVLSPITNLASLRKGGKVRKKKDRGKSR